MSCSAILVLFNPDVDECNENIHRCDQNCHNANGTYACSCDNGHRLGLDGITCYGTIQIQLWHL